MPILEGIKIPTVIYSKRSQLWLFPHGCGDVLVGQDLVLIDISPVMFSMVKIVVSHAAWTSRRAVGMPHPDDWLGCEPYEVLGLAVADLLFVL